MNPPSLGNFRTWLCACLLVAQLVGLILLSGHGGSALLEQSSSTQTTQAVNPSSSLAPDVSSAGDSGGILAVNSPTWPSARLGHTMAYDSESDRIVLFGGRLPGFVASDETWAYDLATNEWTQMSPATRPPARFGHAMVYVPGLDQIVLFGGFGGGSFFSDTWAYDLEANLWSPLSPPSVSPSPRAGSAVAYDGGSGKVVLFGGSRDGVFNNETWAYDPQASTWTKMSPATAPSIRERHRIVYVSASDRILLFGGSDPVENLSGETWMYDFDLDSWTKLISAAAPSPRHGHSMAYEEESDRVILFSGDSNVRNDETWAYNLGTNEWESLSPPIRPLGRVLHSMAYDIESDRVVLFGGEWPFQGTPNDETWAYDYDANTWIPLTRPTAPRNLDAIAGDGGIDLTWTEPARTAEAALTNYRIWRGTLTGQPTLLEQVGPVLAYADIAVTNGVTYFYQVTAVTTAGEGLASREVSATPMDATNPTIIITSPTSGGTVLTPSVQVLGTASDNSGLERVEVSLDGTTWNLATGTTTWSATLILDQGENTIHARATDASGNTATVSITVTLESRAEVGPPLNPFVLGAIAVVAAAAILAVLFMRNRRRGGS
ncbi:MAG TPA: kelch repeat-containing protein [Thermoplasmata archaeon]|nr:kelch repeat-containing protein [Thermoplasmata archaeon]